MKIKRQLNLLLKNLILHLHKLKKPRNLELRRKNQLLRKRLKRKNRHVDVLMTVNAES